MAKHCLTMCGCVECSGIRDEAKKAHGYHIIDGKRTPKHEGCSGCVAMIARSEKRNPRG